jgi:CheY-like chemotaxis protein
LETGKFRIELKPTSLAAVVQEVITMMNPVAGNKNIRLSKTVQTGMSDVLVDENRIKQILANLLNNALKFTPAGGKISIKVTDAPDRQDAVRISVSDTGRGIPADQLDQIFDRLYQVNVGDANGQGIGLGLYICRELVELHGGRIWAESELQQGSTFTFELPKDCRPRRRVVLAIDDDPAVLESVRYALQNTEFEVLVAQGGAEAVRLIEQRAPDLVLTDLKMPEMDGAATLKQIRGRREAVPVIVHTGYPDSEMMTRALEFSPFTVLAKPCRASQLIETVRLLTQTIRPC